MPLTLQLDARRDRSLQEQLFDQIRSLILGGQLRSGDPLPATRLLSEQAGVSRNTVVLAYDRLLTEGYIESRPGVGTFVSRELPERALFLAMNGSASILREAVQSPASSLQHLDKVTPHALASPFGRELKWDFWVGRPGPDTFPVREWRKIIDDKLRYGAARMAEYQDPQGLPRLRRAIAEHVGPARGIATTPDHVVVVSGSQEGLNLVAHLLGRGGPAFVHEDPCYQGAYHLFGSYGFEPIPVPVDEAGLVTQRLPEVTGAIVYVTPSHQFPTGVTLSLPRRMELLAWADRTDSYIVEDDYDSDFRFEGAPLTALRGIDRLDRVIYLGTFSKSLGPALRLGYLIFPPALAEHARAWKTLMTSGSPWLEQAVVAEFMESGAFNRHLRRIRQIYRMRRDTLVTELMRHFGAIEIGGDSAGMHIAWRLPAGWPKSAAIEAIGRRVGIGLYSLTTAGAVASAGSARRHDTILMGFAATHERAIPVAVEVLSRALCAAGIDRHASASMEDER